MRFLYTIDRGFYSKEVLDFIYRSVLISLLLISVSLASTITVNTLNDTHAASPGSSALDGSGNISLRSALENADAVVGTYTINFSITGTINLSLGEISFGSNPGENITIDGSGQTITINMTGTNQDRIFIINLPGTVTNVQVTIQDLTFSNGHLTSDSYGGGAILAGGPSNSLTIHNCVFSSNVVPNGNGTGGAVNYSGGGTLTVDQGSTFSNNQDSDAGNTGGGAVFYFLQNYTNLTGSLNISNCTFNSNTSASSSAVTGGGGAIGIQIQGQNSGQSFSAALAENTFTNNSATAGYGGAVFVENAFAVGNIIHVNYNRFKGNTASAGGGGIAYISEPSSVDATNNWWGQSSVPNSSSTDGAGTFNSGGSGSLTTSPYIVLSNTPAQDTIYINSSTIVTASFLKNSSGGNLTASNLGALIGLPVSFAATAPGGSSISGAQASIQSNGTATATYNAGSTAGSGNENVIIDNDTVSAPITVLTFVLAKLKIFLEGPYAGSSMMSTYLNNILPTSDPYSLNESVHSIPSADIVDWVKVQLRTTTTSVAATRAAFIKKDGSIVDLDGSSNIRFSGVSNGNFYIVIEHRIHLAVMSAGTIALSSSSSTLYDFTTASSKFYGGSSGAKEVETGVWGMIAGDGNGNGQVQNNDSENIWKPDNGTSGYKNSDFNMNGQVQNNDNENYWKPNNGRGTQVPNP